MTIAEATRIVGKIFSYLMGVILVLVLYHHLNSLAAKESLLSTAVQGIEGYSELCKQVSWLAPILAQLKGGIQSVAKTQVEPYIWQVLQYSLILGFFNFKRQFLLHFFILLSVVILHAPKSFQEPDQFPHSLCHISTNYQFFSEQAQNILILGLTGYVSSL